MRGHSIPVARSLTGEEIPTQRLEIGMFDITRPGTWSRRNRDRHSSQADRIPWWQEGQWALQYMQRLALLGSVVAGRRLQTRFDSRSIVKVRAISDRFANAVHADGKPPSGIARPPENRHYDRRSGTLQERHSQSLWLWADFIRFTPLLSQSELRYLSSFGNLS